MSYPHVLFDWDGRKSAANRRKHGTDFELASSIFSDPHVITIADLAHSEEEERWFSIGLAANGKALSVSHLWVESEPGLIKIRLITARKSTPTEIRYYIEGL